jgi:hypothetical protein
MQRLSSHPNGQRFEQLNSENDFSTNRENQHNARPNRYFLNLCGIGGNLSVLFEPVKSQFL